MEIFPNEIWKIILDYMPCEAAIGFCVITRRVHLLRRYLRATENLLEQVVKGTYRHYRSLRDLEYNGFVGPHRLLVLATQRGDNDAYTRLMKHMPYDKDKSNMAFNLLEAMKKDGIKQGKNDSLGEIVDNMYEQRVQILNRIAAGESIENLQYEIEWGSSFTREEYIYYERWGTHEEDFVTYTINRGIRTRTYSSFASITLEQLQALPWTLGTFLKLFKWHRWDLWEAIKDQVTPEHWKGETKKTNWMSLPALNIVWEHRYDILINTEFWNAPLCFYAFCDVNEMEPKIGYLSSSELRDVLRLPNMEAYINTLPVIKEPHGNSGVMIVHNYIECPFGGEPGDIRKILREQGDWKRYA